MALLLVTNLLQQLPEAEACAAALHLGGLSELQPHRWQPADLARVGELRHERDAPLPAQGADVAGDGDGGAAPQFSGLDVPYRVGRVVVAVPAQG